VISCFSCPFLQFHMYVSVVFPYFLFITLKISLHSRDRTTLHPIAHLDLFFLFRLAHFFLFPPPFTSIVFGCDPNISYHPPVHPYSFFPPPNSCDIPCLSSPPISSLSPPTDTRQTIPDMCVNFLYVGWPLHL